MANSLHNMGSDDMALLLIADSSTHEGGDIFSLVHEDEGNWV
jgi:hypothetical protein